MYAYEEKIMEQINRYLDKHKSDPSHYTDPKAHLYCDVDDTIVSSISGTHNADLIMFLRGLDKSKVTLTLWSLAGHVHARGVAVHLGLEDLFDAFLTKPVVTIDDTQITTSFSRNFLPF
jgi:FMN phosphatase YigB (HAD superfamily)